MNRQDMLIGGVAVAVVAVVVLARHAVGIAGTPQPRHEVAAEMDFPVWHPGDKTGGVQDHMGHEWRLHPRWDDYGHVATRHRYPAGIATNVTTVMHHGFDSLRRPAPQDGDWIYHPPSVEVI